jgi:hypothetical protein
MNFKQPMGLIFSTIIVLGMLTACAPVYSETSKKKFYEPNEQTSGHLYRHGRHVHHRSERNRSKE